MPRVQGERAHAGGVLVHEHGPSADAVVAVEARPEPLPGGHRAPQEDEDRGEDPES